MPARGRPTKIDKNAVIDILLMNYKDRLIVDGQKIISKCDLILTIAKELENQLTPISLYTFVSCNKYIVYICFMQ